MLPFLLSLPKFNNEIIMDGHKYSENNSTTAILALQVCTKASKLRLLEINYKILKVSSKYTKQQQIVSISTFLKLLKLYYSLPQP